MIAMVRAFIAIDLPSRILLELTKIQPALNQSEARITLVRPENMHITLKFIGEIDVNTLELVKEAIISIAHQPFDIQLRDIEVNDPRHPRVVWACGYDQGECADLHSKIEKTIAPFGIKREKRRFTSHVTLARVKRFDPSLLPVIDDISATDFGSFTVSGFTLKKSTLTPKGPIYEDILEVTF
jgi:2'-5' RNA ligase